ncbi:O-antigen ligase family protein [Paenibacillus sp. YAF4_2]|uniref:O-antigen ligase family protein n=1 Tax=Paenibacillus sp. YAF4_2 TaxID=3233085 RepID=UPI003F94BEDD
MNAETLLILGLGTSVMFFVTLCIGKLNMRIDAGYVFGLSIFFDVFGYFYKAYLPGNSFFLLLGAPLLPAIAALLLKPTRSWCLFREQGIWLWFAFLLYSALSMAWAASDSNGLMKEQILFIRGIIPGLYMYIIYKKYKRFSWTVVALAGLFYAIVHLLIGEYSTEYPGRLTLPGGNPIFDSRIAFITIAVCLWGRGIPWYIRIVTIGVALTSGLYTQSRGPLAAFIVVNLFVFAVVLIMKWRKGELRIAKYATLIVYAVLIAGAGLIVFVSQPHDFLAGSRLNVLVDSSQLKADDNYLGRLNLQKEAIARFENEPFFGAGLGGSSPNITRDHPHNILVEMASELGVAGMALWLMAFLFSCWAAKRNWITLVLFLQTFGYAQMSGDFGNNYEYIIVAFISLAFLPEREAGGVHTVDKNSLSYNRL